MAAIGASTDRNQDFLGAALSDGGCHGGGDFSKRESAMTMPIGPMIRSASRQATRTGFSPVAPMAAPAFIIAAVALQTPS